MSMHIFLYGPPGVGKSTLGKQLADRLKLGFIDLDQAIETSAGLPIPQIMQGRGEEAFRDLESSALEQSIAEKESVIALGGGALLRSQNRAMAEAGGKIICLMAKPETLRMRLRGKPKARPLLRGNLDEKLTALLASREEHYSSFPLRIETDAAHQDILGRIQIAVGRFHLCSMGEYDALVQRGGIQRLGEMLRLRALERPLVVTDENVSVHYAQTVLDALRRSDYNPGLLTVPAGESHKTLDTVNRLWQGFLETGLDRRSTVIALGGGVIGDLAGFAASTYMRGINWVCVPTTLLSMVDASLGGKTGFDLPEGKNLIGAFHPPKLVLADPHTLVTLPKAELKSGLAEVVKHGIISDAGLFELCSGGLASIENHLDEIVKRAMAVKIKVIEADPYESGLRAALNLGHTVGHAVELVSGFRLRHGEAVAIGMVAEAKLAERLTVAASGLAEAISKPLAALGLPVHIPKELSRGELVRVMRVDKKKADGVVYFALPVEIGKVRVGVAVSDLELIFEED
jgi:shikimate kinase/3-dehydroquinate synthase